jgi:hypothetical protein
MSYLFWSLNEKIKMHKFKIFVIKIPRFPPYFSGEKQIEQK